MIPYPEQEIAEVRLMRAIVELNHRILHTASAAERTRLRGSVENLRKELVALIEHWPIYSEEDFKHHEQIAQGSIIRGPLGPPTGFGIS